LPGGGAVLEVTTRSTKPVGVPPVLVAVILCGLPTADVGVYVTLQAPDALVTQESTEKFPVPVCVQLMVWPEIVPPLRVAVHVLAAFTATGLGVQVTLMVGPGLPTFTVAVAVKWDVFGWSHPSRFDQESRVHVLVPGVEGAAAET